MRTIMVLNAKGGSGKTTLTTNIAGYYASEDKNTVIKDYDSQASSMDWLEQRSSALEDIYGLAAYKPASSHTTSVFAMRLPQNTERVIVDTPAGVDLNRLIGVFKTVDKIVIPVSASAIEIRATAKFIHQLQQFMKLHPLKADIGIVANRVDIESDAYHSMKTIFNNIDLDFVASLSYHDNYAKSAESGSSVFELDHPDVAIHKFEWASLMNWLEDKVVVKKNVEEPKLYAVVD